MKPSDGKKTNGSQEPAPQYAGNLLINVQTLSWPEFLFEFFAQDDNYIYLGIPNILPDF